MEQEKDLLEELRLRAAALVEAKEEKKDELDSDEDEIEDGEEVDDEEDKKSVKESTEIDITSLFDGEEISEEFKVKVTALFEAAVAQKVSAIEANLVESMEEFMAEKENQSLTESEEMIEGLVERVDGYLDYMVEQWMENNEIALERGIKSDLFESFMHGMKGLFTEHMINVPEDEIEVLEQQESEIEELNAKVDGILAENVSLKQAIKEIEKQQQIMEATKGLSDAEAERFIELAEELSYNNEEVFGKKLSVIREQFFGQKTNMKQLDESVETDNQILVESEELQAPKSDIDPGIAALAARLSASKY